MAIKKSTKGYKRNSPDRMEPALRIPSNFITMQDVDFPVLGVDNLGNRQIMYPGNDYVYPGSYVDETPIDVQEPGGVAKSGKWIQKAINPKHKGYCTPMSKKTCTPRRKALARTFKKHHGFHEDGGQISKNWLVGSEDGRMVAQAGMTLPQEKDFVDPMAYHAALDAYMRQIGKNLSVPQVMQNKDLSRPAEMFGGERVVEPITDRLPTYKSPAGIQYAPSVNPFPNRDLSKPASIAPPGNKSRINWGNTVLDALLIADALIPGEEIKDPVVRPRLSYNEHPYGTGSQAIAKHGKELPCLNCGGKMQAGGTMPGMTGQIYAKYANAVASKVKKLEQGGDMPYNELLVHSEGNMHKRIAKYESGGYVNYGPGQFTNYNPPQSRRYGGTVKRMPILYEEGGTYDLPDEEIKRLIAAGYELKIK